LLNNPKGIEAGIRKKYINNPSTIELSKTLGIRRGIPKLSHLHRLMK